MLAAVTDTGYKIVLVAHILFAIVGFGTVFLNGVYALQTRGRKPGEALAIFQANFRVSQIGEYCVYVVFLCGLALVGMSDKAWSFSQTWIWLSTVLFVVTLGLGQGVMRPRIKRVNVLLGELADGGPPPAGGPPPQALELKKIGSLLRVMGPMLDLSMVVILVLMVFRPGAPGFGF